MKRALELFHHTYIDNNQDSTIFLLHGTGGNENDLLPLVAPLADKYNFLGLRGNIHEDGLTRFFKRTAPGIFDQESIRNESKKLAEFIQAWTENNQITTENISFVGYSNGANMILATLFNYPHYIQKAALLHPMLPFTPDNITLDDTTLLVTYGEEDPLVTEEEINELIQVLTTRNANITTFSHPGGHEITQEEMKKVRKFLA